MFEYYNHRPIFTMEALQKIVIIKSKTTQKCSKLEIPKMLHASYIVDTILYML